MMLIYIILMYYMTAEGCNFMYDKKRCIIWSIDHNVEIIIPYTLKLSIKFLLYITFFREIIFLAI